MPDMARVLKMCLSALRAVDLPRARVALAVINNLATQVAT
jgi:hypothetical protein